MKKLITTILLLFFTVFFIAQQKVKMGNFVYSISELKSITPNKDSLNFFILVNTSKKKEVLSCPKDFDFYKGRISIDVKKKRVTCHIIFSDSAPSKKNQDSAVYYYKQQKDGLFLYHSGIMFKNGKRILLNSLNKREENRVRKVMYRN